MDETAIFNEMKKVLPANFPKTYSCRLTGKSVCYICNNQHEPSNDCISKTLRSITESHTTVNWGSDTKLLVDSYNKIESIALKDGESLYILVSFRHAQEGCFEIICSNFGKLIVFGSGFPYKYMDLDIQIPNYLLRSLSAGFTSYPRDKFSTILRCLVEYKHSIETSGLIEKQDVVDKLEDVKEDPFWLIDLDKIRAIIEPDLCFTTGVIADQYPHEILAQLDTAFHKLKNIALSQSELFATITFILSHKEIVSALVSKKIRFMEYQKMLYLLENLRDDIIQER
jgi:hypothetical protein